MRRVRRRRWCGSRSGLRVRPGSSRDRGRRASSGVGVVMGVPPVRSSGSDRTDRTAGRVRTRPAVQQPAPVSHAIPVVRTPRDTLAGGERGEISPGGGWKVRRRYYWGVRPSSWPHLLRSRPCQGELDQMARNDPTRRPAGDRAWGVESPQAETGTVIRMDLTYPPEAEEFRAEIAGWLKDNLPEGWGEPGFAMTPEERKAFNDEWTAKLFAGGWICASWPTEYGGKGLTLLAAGRAERGVRPGRRAAAGRLLRRHPRRPDHPAVGHRGAEAAVHPGHPQGRDRLVPGLQRARRRVRPGRPQDAGRARRRRVGHQRPEGLDHPGAVRRLHLPAWRAPTPTCPSTPASRTCWSR